MLEEVALWFTETRMDSRRALTLGRWRRLLLIVTCIIVWVLLSVQTCFPANYVAENPIDAQIGGLAFAVPGEVDGFAKAHATFGKLTWRDLWEPSIDLARNGFPVPPHLSYQIHRASDFFQQNLKEWSFVESDERPGELVREGEIMKRPEFARTLEIIAGDDGPYKFYHGKIAKSLSEYARANGGIVTMADFNQYQTIITDTLNSTFMGHEVHTCPPPCSGAVLLEGLNIAELLNFTNPDDPVEYHRLVETMKWVSAGRTELGDPDDLDVPNQARVAELQTKEFAQSVVRNISDDKTYSWKHYNPSYEANDPKGTSHYSILDEDGNAVAVTTTVNLYWGAKLHDPATGIILNSEMDDFSIPGRSNAYDLKPSIYNYIKPFKRPLSSTAPTIVVEKGKASLVIGASGGSRIVTSVFQAIVKNYLWDYSLLETIKSSRAHHQLIPEIAYLESGVKEKLIEGLKSRGHKVEGVAGGSVLQGIRRYHSGEIVAVSDFWRKGGVSCLILCRGPLLIRTTETCRLLISELEMPPIAIPM